MSLSTLSGDFYIDGTIAAAVLQPSSGSVGDNEVKALADIAATKLNHRVWIHREIFDPSTAVTATTVKLADFDANATLIAVRAQIDVQATGGDRTVTVDIQKAAAGGAFATVLSATINITNGTVIRTAVLGTISASALASGDTLQAVVTVAGAAGAQAKGLLVTLKIDRKPQ